MADWSYENGVATCIDETNHIKIEVSNVDSANGLSVDEATKKVTVTSALTIADTTRNGNITIDTYTSTDGGNTYPETADGSSAYLFTDNGRSSTATPQTARWKVDNGTATYKQATTEGYSVTSYSIQYTAAKDETLAEITGVNSNATASNFSESSNKITVDASALSAATGVTLTTGSDNYSLELGGTLTDAQKVETKTWSVEGTTATYTKNIKPKFELALDEKSITYSADGYGDGESTELATLTGVNSDANDSDFSEAGNVITLKKGALGESDVRIDTGSGNYTLALYSTSGDDKVAVSEDGTKKFFDGTGDDKGKIVYGAAGTPGYNLTSDSKGVKYYDGSTVRTTLATFSGLFGGLESTELKAETINNQESSDTKYIEVGTNKFTVHYASLGGGDVTLDSATYTLELADDVWQPNNENSYYNPCFYKESSTSATYAIKYHKNYSVAAGNKGITHNEEDITTGAPNNVYATISGLNLGSEDVSDWSEIVTVKRDGTKYTFTLTTDALETVEAGEVTSHITSVSVAGGTDENGTATTAALALPESLTNVEDSNFKYTYEWDISGTTATYQKALKSHYYIDASGAVQYSATAVYIDADGKQATGEARTIVELATLEGIKKGAKDTDFVVDDDGKTITVKAGALGTTDVVFTPQNDSEYTVDLCVNGEEGENVQTTHSDSGEYKFFYDGGNVTLRKVWSAGYALKDADEEAGTTTIKYYDGSTIGDDLATITGINAGLTNLNELLTYDNDKITVHKAALGTDVSVNVAVEAIGDGNEYTLALAEDTKDAADNEWVIDGTTATYRYSTKTNYYINEDGEIVYTETKRYALDESGKEIYTDYVTFDGVKDGTMEADFAVNDKVITIKESAFDTTASEPDVSYEVSTEGNGYTVELAEGMDDPTTTHEWILEEDSGTNQAVYKKVVRRKFYHDTKNNKITYFDFESDVSTDHAEDYAENKNVTVTNLFKVSGYDSGLRVDDFKTEDVDDETEGETPADATEGESEATKKTYAFTVNADKTVTVAKSAVKGENIVLEDLVEGEETSGYTFAALGEDFAEPNEGATPTWSVGEVKDGSKKVLTATLSKSMHSDYILNEGSTKIVYKPYDPEKRDAFTLATITGLNTKLAKLVEDKEVDIDDALVVESDGDGGQIITLSADAIADAKEITLTETADLSTAGFGEYGFKLALADDILTTPEDTWSFSGGKATYKRETPPTYTFTLGGKSSTIEDGGDTLTISNGKGGKTTTSVLATISGLNKNIPAELMSVYVYASDANEGEEGKSPEWVIHVDASALGTDKKVSLTDKSGTYKLELNEGAIQKGKGTETWVVSGTTAKFYDEASEAIDTSDEKKWGYELDGNTITYTAPTIKKGAEPSITINGLVSGLVPNGYGEIEGIWIETGSSGGGETEPGGETDGGSGAPAGDGEGGESEESTVLGTVYISHNLFNKKNITISGNYNLAFMDEAPKAVTTDPATVEGAVTTKPEAVEDPGEKPDDPATVEGAVTEEPGEDASGDDKRAYADYLAAKKAYDAYDDAQAAYEAYETAKTAYEAYETAKAAYDAYQDYLKLKLEETDLTGFGTSDTAKVKTAYDDKKGTFTVKQTLSKEAYTLSANGKAIFYSKNDGDTEIAKLTNLAATSENIGTAVVFNPETGVITLNKEALGNKKIALSGDAGYELKLGISEDEQAIQRETPEWGFNKTTATFKLVTPEGYHLADDKKSVTYDKETAEIYATLSGVNAGLYDKLAKEVYADVRAAFAAEETGNSKFKAIATKLTAENEAKAATDTTKLDETALAAKIKEEEDKFIAANNGSFVTTALEDYITVAESTDNDGNVTKTVTVLKPEALTAGNISLKKGKNAGEETYKLILGENIPKESGTPTEMWSFNNGTATLQTMKQGYYTLTEDTNTAKYTKPDLTDKDGKKTAPTIQISGLATNLLVEGDAIAGITVESDKTITLSSDALNKKNVKLAKGDGYELALENDDDETEITYAWEVKSGKVNLNEQKSEGYELSTDGKTLTYIKDDAKPKAVATITGLNSPGTPTKTEIENDTLAGVEFDSDSGVITITNAALLKEKAKISGSGGYTLEIGETATSGVATFEEPAWYIDTKKKTLVYRQQIKAGGLAVSDDGKSIVKLEAGTAEAPKYANLLTISGLNFNGVVDLTDEDAVEEYLATLNGTGESEGGESEGGGSESTITIEGNIVTLPTELLGSAKITGKGVYKLAVDTEEVATSAGSGEAWVIKGANATYYDKAEQPYYTVDSAKNTISYTAAKAASDGNALVTLKNVASGLVTKTNGSLDEITFDGKKVVLHAGALGTKNVTFEGSTDYTSVDLAGDVPQEGASAVTKAVQDPKWTFKGTTATYTQEKLASYKVDNTTIQYSKPKTAKLATISGLAKGVDEDQKIDPSKTDGTKINKETTTTDIAEDLTPSGSTPEKSGVITLPHEVLYNTNIITKKTNKVTTYSNSEENKATAIKLTQGKDLEGNDTKYTLKVNDEDGSTTAADAWSIKGTTAIYTSSVPDHYAAADDAKTKVSFKAATPASDDPTDKITLTGVKKTTDMSKFTVVDGTKIVTVKDDALKDISKELKLEGTGTYKDYKLAFETNTSSDKHYTESDLEGTWSSSGKTSTLKQKQNEGYTLMNDGKTISYLKAAKEVAVATVKGLSNGISGSGIKAGATISITEKTSKAVTVDGVGYTFSFSKDYSGEEGTGDKAKLVTKAINGGKNADTIEVAGTGLVIKGAGGNDSIKLTGTSTKDEYNTIVYNPGDGDDTITGLTKNDKIQIATAGATATGEKVGSDYVITVTKKGKNKGTITVKNASKGDVNVVDKKEGTYTGYIAGGAGASVDKLLYSDNYALGAELGELMSGNNVNEFSVGEVETGNATDLTKNATPIVTASDKK